MGCFLTVVSLFGCVSENPTTTTTNINSNSNTGVFISFRFTIKLQSDSLQVHFLLRNSQLLVLMVFVLFRFLGLSCFSLSGFRMFLFFESDLVNFSVLYQGFVCFSFMLFYPENFDVGFR